MKFIFLIVFIVIHINANAADISSVFSKGLPPLPKNQEVVMMTVEYKPGESTPPHRHNAHTYVYVLEGSVDMQVAGGEEVTLVKGDTFYEYPDDIHVVSKNASDTDSAKFLVFFIKTIGAPPTVFIDE